MMPPPPPSPWSRRDLLRRCGGGAGLIGLATLLRDERLLGSTPALNPLAARPPQHVGKARSVIWLFMNGGPSQVDTWDHKPELARRDGQELEGFDKNTGFFTGNVGPLMKSPFQWAQHGQSGTWVSDLFPICPGMSTGWRSSTPATRNPTTTARRCS